MKTKITLLVTLFIAMSSLAQNGINYKAIVKDASGNVIVDNDIVVQFSVIPTLATDPPVYVETHSPTTDANGMIILNIGEGAATAGVFTDIDWGSTKHFLKVEVNVGSGLVEVGDPTEFKAVPYALSSADNYWQKNADDVYIENGQIGIGTNAPTSKLEIKHNSFVSDPQLVLNEDEIDFARLTFKNENSAIDNRYWSLAGFIGETLKDNRLNFWNGTNDLMSITGDGHVGIGVGQSPLTDFHLGFGKSALFGSNLSGAGERLMWIYDKFAFRAGSVDSDQWDDANVGTNSFASGRNTVASGYSSAALGANTTASGFYSTSLGYNTEALGNSSLAIGEYNIVNVNALFSIGNGTATTRKDIFTVWRNGYIIAPSLTNTLINGGGSRSLTTKQYVDELLADNASTGLEKITEGGNTGWRIKDVNPDYYGAIGASAIDLSFAYSDLGIYGATASSSLASGLYTNASGEVSTAMGRYTKANSYSSMAIGSGNIGGGNPTVWVDTDPLFEIGNGENVPSNALTVLKNGKTGIGTTTPVTSLHVNHPIGTANGLSISNEADNDRWHFYTWSTNNGLFLYFNNAQKASIDAVSGAYTALSDRNAKKNISSINPVLNKVVQMEVVDYNFKDQKDQRKYVGMIAQDIEPLFPHLVYKQEGNGKDSNETGYMVDYAGFGVLAIKAIQEQQKIIDGQKAELTDVNKTLARLLARIEALEANSSN